MTSPRWCRRGLVALTLAAVLAVGAPTATAPPGAQLQVTVTGFETNEGAAGIAVWSGGEGFPEAIEHAVDTIYVTISDLVATAELGPYPPGTYAVTAYHDKNDNQRFDKNWLGIPREAWGMTRDPRPTLRAPRFDEAQVELAAGIHQIEIVLD